MASQKLMFLKKIDPKRAMEVVAKLRGGAGGGGAAAAGAAPAAAAAPKKAAQSPAIVKALGDRFAKTPNLAKEVGAKVGLVVDDKSWLLDLTGNGAITEGSAKGAAITLTLSDDDLVALAKGENLRDLYQHGRIRIDGDPRVAHKLTFFKGLV
jgi:(3R)-3-hydroxyacyl-CoA dehydrogenase / 3a,7a,12a-trihydroxy-5b-cholest-24-enoyl-CoA hydratase / enoyl-CoA hydratase 2